MAIIKFEAVHKNRISSHIIDDAQGAQTVFLTSIERENRPFIKNPNNDFVIRGFIHELGCVPFGYVLISQLQVCFYKYLFIELATIVIRLVQN